MNQLFHVFLINLIVFFVSELHAQDQKIASSFSPSILGNTGQIMTTNAYFSEDRNFFFGFTHYSSKASLSYEAGISKERSFFLSSTFLPFLELTFRLTKPYNSLDRIVGIGDRSYSAKIRVLKEKKYIPAVAIGLGDPFTANAYFNTQYLVLSKKIVDKKWTVFSHLGYGFKIESANGHILQGLWGGINTRWNFLETNLEYDGNNWNVGLKTNWKERLFFQMALIDLRNFTGSLAFRFKL